MSFRIPTFNLEAGIWRAGVAKVDPPSLVVTAAIHVGRRAPVQFWNHGALGLAVFTPILLPGLTDVRGILSVGGADKIECPLGSARWYLVVQVEDVAKGWPNEYRVAWCAQEGPWPAPVP